MLIINNCFSFVFGKRSLSICYISKTNKKFPLLFKTPFSCCVCVCVCVRESEQFLFVFDVGFKPLESAITPSVFSVWYKRRVTEDTLDWVYIAPGRCTQVEI